MQRRTRPISSKVQALKPLRTASASAHQGRWLRKLPYALMHRRPIIAIERIHIHCRELRSGGGKVVGIFEILLNHLGVNIATNIP